jgi:exopolyphosphatase/guanosine-5'-triphosphate,3'-diphosphate pyrophosphatase
LARSAGPIPCRPSLPEALPPHGTLGPGRRGVYAAIDLGTNNCRLLIARPTGTSFRVIDAFSRIVRLGEGLDAEGRLSEAAMTRTVSALRVCARKCRDREVTHLRAVATEACRRAVNCDAFIARVTAETGIRLEIISSREEARLAIQGCASLIDPELPDALSFDIGGGSTEISWLKVGGSGELPAGGRGLGLGAFWSMPLGVVNMAERHGGRQVSAQGYAAMMAEVRAALGPFEARYRLGELARARRMQMIGTSGTVTTLAGVHQRLPRYDRTRVDGCFLARETVLELSRRIAAMGYEERRAQACIGHQRADLVIAGCAILQALCEIWPVGRLRVADRGLREGILLTLMRPEAQGMSAPAPGGHRGLAG